MLAEFDLDMDSVYSYLQARRTWPSPCSFAFLLGSQPQSQSHGQPQLERGGHDPTSLALLSVLWLLKLCVDV